MGRDPYEQRSSGRHRVERVFDQTVEHLLELLGIGLDFLYLMAPFGSQRNLPAIEFWLEKGETFHDTGIQIERRSHRLRSPGIQQQVLNNFGGPFDLRFHRLQPLPRLCAQSRILSHELDMAGQCGQGSADFMRHGCGNLPDGR